MESDPNENRDRSCQKNGDPAKLIQLRHRKSLQILPKRGEPRISYKDSLRKKLFDYQTVMNGILEAKEKTVLNNEWWTHELIIISFMMVW